MFFSISCRLCIIISLPGLQWNATQQTSSGKCSFQADCPRGLLTGAVHKQTELHAKCVTLGQCPRCIVGELGTTHLKLSAISAARAATAAHALHHLSLQCLPPILRPQTSAIKLLTICWRETFKAHNFTHGTKHNACNPPGSLPNTRSTGRIATGGSASEVASR